MKIEEFVELIEPFPSIKLTWETALASVKKEWDDQTVTFWLSLNCRAYFFCNHLSVEQELDDDAVRNMYDDAIVPFKLSATQLKLLDGFEKRMLLKKRFSQRVMKCRRAKVSTIYLAIDYHMTRFNENMKGLVFADKLDTSRRLKRILDIFYQHDTAPQKPELGKKTLGEGLYFHPADATSGDASRDSFILLGSSEQKNAGLAGGLNFLHWSETSLSEDQMTHWTTISPALKGALFDVAESTPSLLGRDEIIYPAFENATPECDAVFISWMDIPEHSVDEPVLEREYVPYPDHNLYGKEEEILRDFKPSVKQMLWRRAKLDTLRSLNAFTQVYPISKEEAFNAGAGLFFHKDLIQMTTPKVKRDGHRMAFTDQGIGVSGMHDPMGAWIVYRDVEPSAKYLISSDAAEGKLQQDDSRNPDYSVSMVFKLGNPVEEVAILRDRLPPEVLGDQNFVAARHFNDAFIIPERNGPGLAMLIRLTAIYHNIYREQRMKAGVFSMTQDYGLMTTSANKHHVLACLTAQIRAPEKGLILHSEIVRQEMGKYVQKGLKFGAMSGFHDDTISCLWLMAVGLFQMPSLLFSTGRDTDPSCQQMPRQHKFEREEWNYAPA